jgi:hypothetical protein
MALDDDVVCAMSLSPRYKLMKSDRTDCYNKSRYLVSVNSVNERFGYEMWKKGLG